MKQLLSVALFLFAASGQAWAQDETPVGPQRNGNAAADLSRASAASHPAASPEDSVSADASSLVSYPFASGSINSFPPPTASSAHPDAAPAPVPSIKDIGRENRWQIGLGVALVRFRSSAYLATAVGLNSSLAYFVKDSLAIEGAVTSAFAPSVYQSFEQVRYAGYGAGPKYVFDHDALQPWVHVLVGGIYIFPQTALGSHNGFELLAGGGADYAFTSSLAVRLEADYLRTYVFKQSQNFGQASLGLVYRF